MFDVIEDSVMRGAIEILKESPKILSLGLMGKEYYVLFRDEKGVLIGTSYGVKELKPNDLVASGAPCVRLREIETINFISTEPIYAEVLKGNKYIESGSRVTLYKDIP